MGMRPGHLRRSREQPSDTRAAPERLRETPADEYCFLRETAVKERSLDGNEGDQRRMCREHFQVCAIETCKKGKSLN